MDDLGLFLQPVRKCRDFQPLGLALIERLDPVELKFAGYGGAGFLLIAYLYRQFRIVLQQPAQGGSPAGVFRRMNERL